MKHLRLVEIRRLFAATQHGGAMAETASHAAATAGDAQEQEKAQKASQPAEPDIEHGGGLFL